MIDQKLFEQNFDNVVKERGIATNNKQSSLTKADLDKL
jgi:hypothetical protein